MVLTGHITDDDDTHFSQEIDSFVQWCVQNYLALNVCKTGEMLIDFRINTYVSGFVERYQKSLGRASSEGS